jgi:hypothetical protein
MERSVKHDMIVSTDFDRYPSTDFWWKIHQKAKSRKIRAWMEFSGPGYFAIGEIVHYDKYDGHSSLHLFNLQPVKYLSSLIFIT